MFAITGSTGRVGGHATDALVGAGQMVRVLTRDPSSASHWGDLGCEVATADLTDAASLIAAFSGCAGAFVMVPPGIDQPDDLPKAKTIVAAIRKALIGSTLQKVVALSSVGAQSDQPNLLSELTLLERGLADIDVPITFLRPAWYIENAEWDVASAQDQGVIHSHLQPVDRKISMVSVADAGRVAAELLLEEWSGHRIVELHGPAKFSPRDLAASFSRALGRSIDVIPIPRAEWEGGFRRQGIENPGMWMAALDGFNEGWLDFEGGALPSQKGRITADEAIAALVRGAEQ